MIKKSCGVLAAALLMGLASCSDENPWMGEAGKGAIVLNLTADGSVEDAAAQTRATVNGSQFFEVPDASDFSVHLQKHDGSFSNVYEKLEHFTAVNAFPTGTYNLRVFFGRLEDQGFEKPFLEGTETINVLEARTTEVTVHAKVANSLFNVSYTENFKNYLSKYSTTLSTEYGPVEFAGDEEGTAFLAPGEVKLTVSFTNPQGQSVTLQPASVQAQAGHHYNIKFDVAGGESAVPELSILFDEELTQETVTIDLTEELFTAPAPTIKLVGTEETAEGETPSIEYLAGAANDTKYRFNVISHGGLSQVTMTLASTNGFTPDFGSPVDLIGADASKQAQLAALGFDIKGLFKNPAEMAFVDFTKVLEKLPAGNYTLTLQAMDALTRSSQPVSVNLVAVEPTLEAEPMGALAGLNVGMIRVTYTGSHPMDDLSFEALNESGINVKCELQNATEVQKTRSIPSNSYDLTIKLPDTGRDVIPVSVYLYGKKMTTVDLEVTEPAYTLEADGFAHKAWIKVVPEEKSMAGLIASNLKLYLGGSRIAVKEIDSENGIITIDGLEKETDYTVQGTLLRALPSNAPQATFRTETEQELSNGDFSRVTETINIASIPAGGIYDVSFLGYHHDYQNISSIKVSTPEDWGNINGITCNEAASDPKNTWYVVPSTYYDDAAQEVAIRTVGYSYNGPTLETFTGTSAGNYYSTITPDPSLLDKAAGQLFYGEDSKTGKEIANRPAYLQFTYKFSSVGGEKAGAVVKVYSGAVEIGSGKLDISDAEGTGVVAIDYDPVHFKQKATSISVKFMSSTSTSPAIVMPTDLDDNDARTPKTGSMGDISNRHKVEGWGSTLAANTYKSFAAGSELRLKTVSLGYGEAPAMVKSSRGKAAKSARRR